MRKEVVANSYILLLYIAFAILVSIAYRYYEASPTSVLGALLSLICYLLVETLFRLFHSIFRNQ